MGTICALSQELLRMPTLHRRLGPLLREVLKMPVTMPVWVEQRMRSILARFEGRPFDTETIKELRAALAQEGLESALGEYLTQAPQAGGDQ